MTLRTCCPLSLQAHLTSDLPSFVIIDHRPSQKPEASKIEFGSGVLHLRLLDLFFALALLAILWRTAFSDHIFSSLCRQLSSCNIQHLRSFFRWGMAGHGLMVQSFHVFMLYTAACHEVDCSDPKLSFGCQGLAGKVKAEVCGCTIAKFDSTPATAASIRA